MNDFTFRYRFTLANRSSIGIETPSLTLHIVNDHPNVVLAAADQITPLKTAKEMVLRSSGWETEGEALEKGNWYSNRLLITLVRHRIGVWPEQFVSRGKFYNHGLRLLEEEKGQCILNDTIGLSVFPTTLSPGFAKLSASISLQISLENFIATFSKLCSINLTLKPRDHLAIDLFNSSFLQKNSTLRLLTLVMAVESLLEPLERPQELLNLIDNFIKQTKAIRAQYEEQCNSLKGALRSLRFESITKTAQRLINERLGNREYSGLAACKFFNHCYVIRSKIVHGTAKKPSNQEVSNAVATLEVLVSDLICSHFFPR